MLKFYLIVHSRSLEKCFTCMLKAFFGQPPRTLALLHQLCFRPREAVNQEGLLSHVRVVSLCGPRLTPGPPLDTSRSRDGGFTCCRWLRGDD